MYDYHVVVSIVAAAIGIAGFVPYFRDIFRGETKPHLFTWLVWGLLAGVAGFVQAAQGGGVAAWITLIDAIGCLCIAASALWWGAKHIRPIDWVCLIGALVGIVVWKFANDALLAVVIASLVDTIGYVPTMRKAYGKPREETAALFVFSAIRWGLSIIALQSLTLTTVLYPAGSVCIDVALISLLVVRRRQLARHPVVR